MIDAEVDHDRAANAIAAERTERHAVKRHGAPERSTAVVGGTLAGLPSAPMRTGDALLVVPPRDSAPQVHEGGGAFECAKGPVFQIVCAAALVVALLAVWVAERRSARKGR